MGWGGFPKNSEPKQVSFAFNGKEWTDAKGTGDKTALAKIHGLQGPIDDAFMDSFVFYKPSKAPMNETTGKWVDSELNHAVKEWRKQFRGDITPHSSSEFVWEDVEHNHMVLWGDPQSNPIIGKLLKDLPIKWTSETIEFNGTTYDAKSHVPVMVFPNPLNPKKYVVLNSGFTFREYDYLNNARQVSKLPDYAIIDVNTPANSRYPGKVVRAGFFDERWKLQPNDGK